MLVTHLVKKKQKTEGVSAAAQAAWEKWKILAQVAVVGQEEITRVEDGIIQISQDQTC